MNELFESDVFFDVDIGEEDVRVKDWRVNGRERWRGEVYVILVEWEENLELWGDYVRVWWWYCEEFFESDLFVFFVFK